MGRFFGLMAPLLLLAGCADEQQTLRTQVLEQVLASNRASIAALETTTPGTQASGQAGNAAPGAGPRRAVDIEGADARAVLAWLGQPTLRRSEGDAEIWRYQGTACHLDMVLYRDGQGGLRVGHATTRAAGIERMTESDCLQSLAQRR
ncbi:hypothetical protein IAI18_04670 [Acetobacteraceae bacterium H6797]|nr:hypothetical protein [Acetobacteraceae bacterium H6797]